MPAPLVLPSGSSQRPLTLADAPAVTAVMAAGELVDAGEVVIEEADLLADWSMPSFAIATSTVAVAGPDGKLVAYAEVSLADRAAMAVHPGHRGAGLEEQLARWIRERSGEAGSAVVGMPVAAGSQPDRALEALGWEVRWTSWVLSLPDGAALPERSLPAGFGLRVAAPEDLAPCWNLLEDAFLEWSRRERRSLVDWLASVVGRPGFAPWNLRVVTDADGVIVAACVIRLTEADGVREGWVDKVATRRDLRGHGIAQALLADAFAAACEHGAVRSSLSTDSRTGALGLYERLGMEVTSTWLNRAAPTLPGRR